MKRTALYVEDEPKIRQSYAKILREKFPNTFTASDAYEALRLYEEHNPDLIIVDIVLPGFDGLELVKRIREVNLRTRIIIFTAYNDTERLLKAASLNISNFLVKPVRKKDFLESIDKSIEELQLCDKTTQRSAETPDGNYPNQIEHLRLTPNESELLAILSEIKGRCYSMDEIISIFLSEYNKNMTENAIKSTISRLRKKYPEIEIENLYGIGYRIKPQ